MPDGTDKPGGGGFAPERFEQLLCELLRTGFPDHEGFVLLVNDRMQVASLEASHHLKIMSDVNHDESLLKMLSVAKTLVEGPEEVP